MVEGAGLPHGSSLRPGGLLSHFLSLCLSLIKLKNNSDREPAVSVMAMSLDSHVVDRGSRPGPGGLKLTLGVCVCVPKIPRGEWRRRDYGVAIRGGSDFSSFLSFSFFFSFLFFLFFSFLLFSFLF